MNGPLCRNFYEWSTRWMICYICSSCSRYQEPPQRVGELQSAPSSRIVCVPTSAVLPAHHLSSLNCPNLFKLSLMTDSRYTGPRLTGSPLQYHTHNCQYKGKPTHGLAHWLGLLLYSYINLRCMRQVGGGSGRCSPEEWR